MTWAASPEIVGGAATSLTNAGPFGAVLVFAFAFFYLVWKRERDRADRADAAKDAMVRELIDKIMPLVGEAVRTQRDFIEVSRNPGRG